MSGWTHGAARPQALSREQLVRRCDLSAVPFTTTADLADIDLMVGQERAGSAIAFGAEVSAQGFNLFVIGASPDSLDEAVKALLDDRAKVAPRPGDWVYLNNFAAPHKPIAMALPPTRGPSFREAMRELVQDLKVALPVAFESDDYQARRTAIEQEFSKKQEAAFKVLQEEATASNVVVIRTPFGFSLAPMKDGQVLRPEAFNDLPEAERTRVHEAIKVLETKLETVLRSVPVWDKQRRTDLRKLGQETTENAIGHLIEEIKGQFVAPTGGVDNWAMSTPSKRGCDCRPHSRQY